MKAFTLVAATSIILAASLPVSSQDPGFGKSGKVVKKYDKKQNKTIVGFGPLEINARLMLSALFTYDNDAPVKPHSIDLIFWSTRSPGFRWERSTRKDLEVIADGQSWTFSPELLNSSRNIESVRELLGVAIPLEVFVKIANAKKVSMRLGDEEFKLNGEHLKAIRSLASSACG